MTVTFSNELFGLFSAAPKLTGTKEDIKILKDTYLNDEWLKKRQPKKGKVSFKYGTYITDNIGSTLQNLIAGFNKSIQGNIATLKKFDASTAPLKKIVQAKQDNPNAVEEAEGLELKLHGLPARPTQELSTLSRDGLKSAARVYVDVLNDRTNLLSTNKYVEELQQTWHKLRHSVEHDTDADLICRAVIAVIKGAIDSDTELDMQSNEGFDTIKKNLLRDLSKLMSSSI
ncbi:hypothetical protein AVT69_gp205 [Pseudomonas phage PhiPA3]|uniref:Uncharacterized protein 207 n=1 Tax=Pseudomonas phage PhiPA3 TaxID=998086 RepID=F8SJ50_BPPA3|nr:hypothetical protein AVT69_gp205 [Pseudomonas phage PhiPA3]AEH03630.1 hypothetical protein [Pseudomonas phage PhiPA3]